MMSQWPQKPPLGVPINWGHPDAQGLVGCWLFNEGSGDKVNDLVNGNTGTLTSMDPPTDWLPGLDGHCLDFDGTDDAVVMAAWSASQPAAWTIEVLMRTSTAENRMMCGWETGFNPGLYPYFTDRPLLYMGLNNYKRFIPEPLTLCVNGQWHEVVATCPGTAQTDVDSARMWVDGAELPAGQVVTTGTQNAKAAFRISGYANFLGQVARVRLWERCLETPEVSALSSQPYAMFGWQRLWVVAAAAGNWLRSPFDAGLNVKNPVYDYGWQ